MSPLYTKMTNLFEKNKNENKPGKVQFETNYDNASSKDNMNLFTNDNDQIKKIKNDRIRTEPNSDVGDQIISLNLSYYIQVIL